MTNTEAIEIIKNSPVWDCLDTNRAGVEESNKLNQALDLAISALSRDRWISVEERLPEEHVFVLICNDDEKQMIAEIYNGDWWYRYYAYDTDRWYENEQGRVVAWRPLPETPKKNQFREQPKMVEAPKEET